MSNQVFLSYDEAIRDWVAALAHRLHADGRLTLWFAISHSVPAPAMLGQAAVERRLP